MFTALYGDAVWVYRRSTGGGKWDYGVGMNIVVFGSTGKTGLEVVKQALAQGHTVRAFARTPAKLTLKDSRLEVMQGDVLDAATVEAAVRGQDAVVCALGGGPLRNTTLRSEGTRHLISAMKNQGVQRLVVVTSMGTNESWKQLRAFAKVFFRFILSDVIKDHGKQEDLVRASGLLWTILRPSRLTDDPRTGAYTASTDLSVKAGRIARADVADFVMTCLAAGGHVGEAVAVTN